MALVGLVAAFTLVAVGSRDDALAGTFVPTTYDIVISNNAVSANSNFTVEFELDSPQALEAAHVSFIPADFGVAADVPVPDGARVGSIAIQIVESVSNGPCGGLASRVYDLFDATTNTAMLLADTPRIPAAGWPGFADSNVNDLPDAIDQYPTFLTTLFPGATPRARAYGAVIGTINQVVNVLVFDPGTTLPGLGTPDPGLGYPVVVVQQDPTAPAATATITAQCTRLRMIRQDLGVTFDNFDTTLVDESGFAYRTNPSTDGDYTFVDYSQSRRDFDRDGIENSLDTCPFDATPSWNPRVSDPVNDPDGDGIPGKDAPGGGDDLVAGTGCDPTPAGSIGSDEDGDGFDNREDNCPLVPNGAAQDNQADPDGDHIGSACDLLDLLGDGHLHEVCATFDVAIGTGGTPTTPTCPDFVADQDNDGFDDTDEALIGTAVDDPCGNDGWPADVWAQAVSGSGNLVDILDITSFIVPAPRKLDTNPGDAGYDQRWDLKPGKAIFLEDINIQDLTALLVGTTGFPPMLEGARAFDGPSCPYPP